VRRSRNRFSRTIFIIYLLACGLSHADAQQIGNATISANIHIDAGRLHEITFRDEQDGSRLAVLPEAFQIQPSGGPAILASDFVIDESPVESTVNAGQAEIEAKQLCTRLVHAESGLHAMWCLVQPADAHYIRETLELQATRGDLPIETLQLLDVLQSNAHVAGSVSGSPAISGNSYLGFEHPLSNIKIENGELRAFITRSLPLRAGTSVSYSSVIGIAAPGQMRRDFLAYVERERPRKYKPFLHYNSWYDLGYTNRFGEQGALDRIHAFGDELSVKRAVKVDSFLFDDGWDNPSTLWGFDSGFPHGFTKSSQAAAQYGAGIGVWLSPWGGYDEQKKQRIAFGRAAGYEIVDDGYALSGPRYYQAFLARCLDMIDTYHVNQFKFDGTGNANHVFPGSLFDSDFEAAIALITRLRKEEPQLFVNLTTGTFPSPFWLRYADSIWRGGEDHDFAGVGTWRQKWITYRDAQTYKNIVQAGPLFPLNSLMLHGLIWAKSADHLQSDPGHDFSSEVWSYFGSGTQLQEMYVTPSLLATSDWDTLAEAAKWSRKNQDVLRDSHWIGGDPAQLNVYGWASWSPVKSIVVLRNPSDKPQTFSLDIAVALQLPPDAANQYRTRLVFGTTNLPSTLLKSRKQSVSLHPFEVAVIDLSPTVH
jgi:hypothetical protein